MMVFSMKPCLEDDGIGRYRAIKIELSPGRYTSSICPPLDVTSSLVSCKVSVKSIFTVKTSLVVGCSTSGYAVRCNIWINAGSKKNNTFVQLPEPPSPPVHAGDLDGILKASIHVFYLLKEKMISPQKVGGCHSILLLCLKKKLNRVYDYNL